MKIMLFLILISLLLALGFLFSFFRAAKDGQFDDDYTPSVRMLFEGKTDEEQPKSA
jgi:cbb3-type cytochrome oxidase maturation protein